MFIINALLPIITVTCVSLNLKKINYAFILGTIDLSLNTKTPPSFVKKHWQKKMSPMS
jgi:hypothetical protein